MWSPWAVLLLLAQCCSPVNGLVGVCRDDPLVSCPVLDREAHICTQFRDSQETRSYCPKYCGLCGTGSHTTQTGPVIPFQTTSPNPHPGHHFTSKTVAQHSTSAPFTGLCIDDPDFNCADMDRSAKICTVFRDSLETRNFCPKYCGLCGSKSHQPHTTSTKLPTTVRTTRHETSITSQTTLSRGHETTKSLGTTAPNPTSPKTTSHVSANCHDDPNIDCADMDNTAKICTVYRDVPDTIRYCRKYCGLCGHGGQQTHTKSTDTPSTTEKQTPATPTVSNSPTATRTSSVPLTTKSASSVTTSPPSFTKTTSHVSTTCFDDPKVDCADLDNSAKICTVYRDAPDTRRFCSKYCGLCGHESHTPHTMSTTTTTTATPAQSTSPTTATSQAITSSTTTLQNTTSSVSTGCFDDPSADCADLDNSAKICTVFRDATDTRRLCSRYCGLCTHGTGSTTSATFSTSTPSISATVVTTSTSASAATTSSPATSTSKRMTSTPTSFSAYSASATGHLTMSTATHAHVVSSGQCHDDPTYDCATMDKQLKLCTIFKNAMETKKFCPKYCGICTSMMGSTTSTTLPKSTPSSSATVVTTPTSATSAATTSSPATSTSKGMTSTSTSFSAYSTSTVGHLTITTAPHGVSSGDCVDNPAYHCAKMDQQLKMCTFFRDSLETKRYCPKYCGLCVSSATPETHPMSSTMSHTVSTSTTLGPTETPSSTGIIATGTTPSTPTKPPTTHGLSSGQCSDDPNYDCAKLNLTLKLCTMFRNADDTKKYCPKYCGLCSVGTTVSRSLETESSYSTRHLRESTTTTPSNANHEEFLAMVFSHHDADNDQKLSFQEFDKMWAKKDLNGDNRITLGEYASSSHYSKIAANRLFQFIDHDHNNVITIQELPHIFLSYDTSGDGMIEKNEFVKQNLKVYQRP